MKPETIRIKAIEQSAIGILGTIYYPDEQALYELL